MLAVNTMREGAGAGANATLLLSYLKAPGAVMGRAKIE